MERMRVDKIIGKTVVTGDGVELGEVLDLEVEVGSWRVTWLFIRLHRELVHRFKGDAPLVMGSAAIGLTPVHVETVSDKIVLKGSLSEVATQAVVSTD